MSKVFTIAEGLENMGAIKSGGQGSVYKGRRMGEIITAIKLLPTPVISQNEDDKHYRDFSNEVEKLQRVNEVPNPNVVKILSYGVTDTGCFPYIEMEYIDGPDLGELLKPPHPLIFTVSELTRVAHHLSNALAHCHKLDVKHGDIKSNNVKYNRHTGNYVLIDFGLAIQSDEERRSSMRRAGAIEFMAPEQNEGNLFFETDVYSFGIILFELLTGQVPFPLDGNSETARNKVMVAHMETAPPDALALRAAALPAHWTESQKQSEMQVPEWLLKMIEKCLQKKPADRFANGAVLHEHITHHRIYSTEVAPLVKAEDRKWQAVVAKKDEEIQRLQAAISRHEGAAKQQPLYYQPVQKGVSRGAFAALLLALLMVTGLAVYGLFFNKPAVSGAAADNGALRTEATPTDSQTGSRISENNSNARQGASLPQQTTATTAPVTTTAKRQNSRQTTDSTSEEQAARKLAETAEQREKANGAVDGEEPAGAVRYKVRGKAYFHDEPDAGTRRNAFIVHWNNAVLKPLNEKDGFVYIVFTNHLGQTSKGWLAKADLVPVN